MQWYNFQMSGCCVNLRASNTRAALDKGFRIIESASFNLRIGSRLEIEIKRLPGGCEAAREVERKYQERRAEGKRKA